MQVATGEKAPGAFKTIGELSRDLGVAQHILRYWETKFPQLKPLQRAGNRRYYRPADVDLARRINQLLNEQGYTVRGVQQLLRDGGGVPRQQREPEQSTVEQPQIQSRATGVEVARLIEIRDRLSAALAT
jgi:DNA-binding transcriptional MerR regulator